MDEKIVSTILIRNGFVSSVNKTKNTNGFDVIAIRTKDNKGFVIEVKKACKDKNKNAWRTRGMSVKTIKSDLVAIILPSKRVFFDSIENHLKCCNKNGDRYVTKMVEFDFLHIE